MGEPDPALDRQAVPPRVQAQDGRRPVMCPSFGEDQRNAGGGRSCFPAAAPAPIGLFAAGDLPDLPRGVAADDRAGLPVIAG